MAVVAFEYSWRSPASFKDTTAPWRRGREGGKEGGRKERRKEGWEDDR